MILKYIDLKIGDIFTVDREENKIAYVKDEFWYQQLNSGKKFKALNGCTKVKKIGEML